MILLLYYFTGVFSGMLCMYFLQKGKNRVTKNRVVVDTEPYNYYNFSENNKNKNNLIGKDYL